MLKQTLIAFCALALPLFAATANEFGEINSALKNNGQQPKPNNLFNDDGLQNNKKPPQPNNLFNDNELPNNNKPVNKPQPKPDNLFK